MAAASEREFVGSQITTISLSQDLILLWLLVATELLDVMTIAASEVSLSCCLHGMHHYRPPPPPPCGD